MGKAPLLFLDANVLASPVTRTLLIAGARADGLRWTWSRHVEIEADRHARGQASRTSIVRKTILGTLVAQFAGAYSTRPAQADLDQPSTIFRGIACIRCESRLDDTVDLQLGLCPEHLVASRR